MKAGNRKQMSKAGLPKIRKDVFRNRCAVAGQKGCCYGPGLPWQGFAKLLRNTVPGSRDTKSDVTPDPEIQVFRPTCVLPVREGESYPAKALKPGGSCKIIGFGHRRSRRLRQSRR